MASDNGEPGFFSFWKPSPHPASSLFCSPRMGRMKTPEKVRQLLAQHDIKCDVQFVETDRYHEDYGICMVIIEKFAKYVNRHGVNYSLAEDARKSLVKDCGIKISQVEFVGRGFKPDF